MEGNLDKMGLVGVEEGSQAVPVSLQAPWGGFETNTL